MSQADNTLSTTPPEIPGPAAVQRVAVERAVEALIDLLDALDPDSDLEANGDDEPSLGDAVMTVSSTRPTMRLLWGGRTPVHKPDFEPAQTIAKSSARMRVRRTIESQTMTMRCSPGPIQWGPKAPWEQGHEGDHSTLRYGWQRRDSR
jgi:hypothetical protein